MIYQRGAKRKTPCLNKNAARNVAEGYFWIKTTMAGMNSVFYVGISET